MQWWNKTSWNDAVLLGKELDWSVAPPIQFAVLAALCIGLRHWDRDKYSLCEGFACHHGNLPQLWGALALALLA